MSVYNLLLKLLNKKYYEKEVVLNKIDFFFAMSRISEEEYSDLMLKVEDVYIEIEEIAEVEDIAEENIENEDVV